MNCQETKGITSATKLKLNRKKVTRNLQLKLMMTALTLTQMLSLTANLIIMSASWDSSCRLQLTFKIRKPKRKRTRLRTLVVNQRVDFDVYYLLLFHY